jgi:tRNA G18 (ribose-2'-O)-methylase SpoU
MDETGHPVRCPDPGCAAVFPVAPEGLGRNTHCPVCGMRMTARPVEIEARLRAQQERIRGVEGSPISRLPLVVLVDNVRSLWNIGAIFRTADACGVGEVVLAGISGCPPRREIAKTALGAEEAVAWRYRADAGEALREIIAEGYVPVAIETSARAVSLREMVWPERTCLVMGNEVAGISPPVLEACPRHVSIPMRGLKDSLNVAVAFGIVAFRAAEALSAGRSVPSDSPRTAPRPRES